MPPRSLNSMANALPDEPMTEVQGRELRARGRQTMRRLLDAGIDVFAARGYHAARVDDIVDLAHTSHGTFYLYFSNKEELFRALAGEVSDRMITLAEALPAIGPDRSGYVALRSWVEEFSGLYERYGPVIRVWTEAETAATDVGRLGTRMLTEFTATLRDRIAQVDTRTDPDAAALAVLAMLERTHYYVISRRVPVARTAMLDTLARIVHVGVFGGTEGSSAS